ncbi:RING-type domain-containing protein [Caenorhabditis elegans]|uniref:RING-type domain-containing protein n=1 Tax=Caenorhabditis elegans TaxID=6239 RepID=Q22846_CAEEL|nr:RING-type domain-containing protein [Caenorhabditis elegans]CAA90996.3 RING-type domain-containing protein [Caenorhabditis elegans]|eukprot:NP_501525.3 Uncharacterized protein CELE_T28C6.5 [Caenorhabditis elegans]
MGANGIDSEKFRKQLSHLFTTSSPKCPSLSKNFRGRQISKGFVPSLLQSNNAFEINVKDIKITTSVTMEGVTHHYSVSWMDVEKAEKDMSSSGSDEPGINVKKAESIKKIEEGFKTGKIKCDGPCGKLVNINEVAQFGCDHLICDSCRQSQKSATLFDGSPGCCNSECLAKAETDGLKLRSGRRIDSTKSSVSLRSNDGPWEVLHVHVSIVKKWTGKLYRTQLDYEFSSQTRVAELAKTLEAFKDIISSGRSYYSMCKPRSYKDLHPIAIIDTNLRFYHLSGYKPLNGGKLYILITGQGVLLK